MTVKKFKIRLSALLDLLDKAKTIYEKWNKEITWDVMFKQVWHVVSHRHIGICDCVVEKRCTRALYAVYVYWAVNLWTSIVIVGTVYCTYVSTIQDLGPAAFILFFYFFNFLFYSAFVGI